MESQSSHENAARLKTVLLMALAAALAWSAFSLYRLGAGVWELGRLAFAEVRGSAKGDPWAALADIDGATWVSMIVWIAVLPVLGKLFLVLLKAPWGKDFSWSDGQWIDTDPMAMRSGSVLPLAAPLKESMTGYKVGMAVMGAISGFALLATAGSIDMPVDGSAPAPLDLLPLFGALLFASFVAYACAAIFTRRVQFDDAGICDANFFRSQRVAWSAVQEISHATADNRPSLGSTGSSAASSPAWLLQDPQGRTILELAGDMVPQESLEALRARFQSRSDAGGFGFLNDTDAVPMARREREQDRTAQANVLVKAQTKVQAKAQTKAKPANAATAARASSASQPGKKRQWTEQEKEAAKEAARARTKQGSVERVERTMSGSRNRNGLIAVAISVLLILYLLVVPAANTTYNALWFTFAAERVQGVVVEIQVDDPPSLVVEYRMKGMGPARIRSDGLGAYSDYKVGDEVGVFYDPALPGRVRLDLFMELWFSSVLLWSLALAGAIATALVAWIFRRPRAA